MTNNDIEKSMAWALSVNEQRKIELTIFINGNAHTLIMAKETAKSLSETIDHCTQSLC